MASAGTVTVDFAAETAKFTAELKRVNKSLDELQSGFTSVANVAKSAFSFISAASILSFAKSAFDAADALGDAASRAGVAVDALSRLKFAAEQNDVSFESLTAGIKKLQDNLSNAARGSAEAQSAFNALGLDATALKGKALEQQLGIIAERFKTVADVEDQTRIAIDFFGKSAGPDLVPFLNQGAAGLEALMNRADELGITLSGRTSAGIDAADKALKQMNSTVSSFFANIAGGLALSLGFGEDEGPIGALKKQIADLEAARAPIFESIRQGATFSEDSGTLKYFNELNKKIGESILRLQKLEEAQTAVTRPSGSLAADGLQEFTPTASKIGQTNAEKAAQADEELKQILAQNRQETENAEFASYVKRLQAAQAWKDGVARLADELSVDVANSLKRGLDSETEALTRSQNTRMAIEQNAATQRKQVEQSVVSSGIQALNAWNAASTKKSKELVAINKLASIAMAVHNTSVGYTKALALQGPFGYAAAAAILISGAAQVAAIAKTDYGSSGNSSTASGTSVNPIYTQSSDSDTGYGATTQTAVQVIISGNFGFDEYVTDKLIEAVREAVNGRDVVIFNKESLQGQILKP